VVLFNAEPHVSQDLTQQGPDDDLAAVIGEHYNAPFSIAEGIVAPSQRTQANPAASATFLNCR
jgi:hypothetical protein